MHFKQTQYGFEWGGVEVLRHCSDDKKGWVLLGVQTKKYPRGKDIDIYITKSGKVRIHVSGVEWKPPKKKGGK